MDIITLPSATYIENIVDAAGYATEAWTENYIPQALRSWMDVFPWKSKSDTINYIKDGVPTGTGVAGEVCLNVHESIPLLHTYTVSWSAGTPVSTGDHFCFRVNGTDVSGDSGIHVSTKSIYEWTGTSLEEDVSSFNDLYPDLDGKVYRFDGAVWSEFTSGSILTPSELDAINGANTPSSMNVFATMTDIPSPQLTSNELTAINNASLANTDTVAKTSDIPSPQLSSDELTAINNASLANTDTVAKLSDIVTGYPSFQVLPIFRMKTSTFYWATYKDTNAIYGVLYAHISNTNNDYATMQFEANMGIYELIVASVANANLGKATVYVDNVEQGSFDMYDGAWIPNTFKSVFLSITTSGEHTLKFLWGKNASSSGYSVLISRMELLKVTPGYSFVWKHFLEYNNTQKAPSDTVVAGNAMQRNAEGAATPNGEYFIQHPPALNDGTQSPEVKLPAGNYELILRYMKNTNTGIVSVYLEGTSFGSIDTYAGSLVVAESTINFTLVADTTGNFRYVVSGKNGSSSNYYFCLIYSKLNRIS